MHSQVEQYLDVLCRHVHASSARRRLIRQEFRDHLEDMLAEQTSLPKDAVVRWLSQEFGDPRTLGRIVSQTLYSEGASLMKKQSFTRRIVMPPALVFGTILLMVLGNKLASGIDFRPLWHIAKTATAGILMGVGLLAPALICLLCYYQGCSRRERMLVVLIPTIVGWFLHLGVQITFNLWFLLHPTFFGVTGAMLVQLALMEMWILHRDVRRMASAVVE